MSHEGGRVPLEEARAIVTLAMRNGVNLIDTAVAYGDSEEVPMAAASRSGVCRPAPAVAIYAAAACRARCPFAPLLRVARETNL